MSISPLALLPSTLRLHWTKERTLLLSGQKVTSKTCSYHGHLSEPWSKKSTATWGLTTGKPAEYTRCNQRSGVFLHPVNGNQLSTSPIPAPVLVGNASTSLPAPYHAVEGRGRQPRDGPASGGGGDCGVTESCPWETGGRGRRGLPGLDPALHSCPMLT